MEKASLKFMTRTKPFSWSNRPAILALSLGLGSVLSLAAAPATIFEDNFDSYSGPATSLTDTNSANPPGLQTIVTDDDPVAPLGAGTGVQLVNWMAASGTQSLLIRSGSEAQVQIQRPRSGSRYQLDFRLNTAKGAGDRNFYLIVRAMGNDTNGEDFMAYRSDRAAGNATFYYDGIGTGGWTPTPVSHVDGQWEHHRFIFDMRTLTFDLYVNDMTTPVVADGEISRSGAAVPTSIILRHEGNSEDDGYFAIDDLSLTVEDSRDLSSTFSEGFESYPAAAPDSTDDANPLGPWITNEADGTGDLKPLNPVKVQVVDSATIAPHSGTKALKIEGGQRAGVTFAWGSAPENDVQITWWARVPASVDGVQANYLRMSLYGIENGRADQGDSALMGYGSRDATIGDETSLTIYTTAWQETPVDFTPDTWEQYRLVTHVEQGSYTLLKNPGAENEQVIADRAPFIGTATTWGPNWMVGFSSSNGSGHPPVYVDDIEIVSLTTSVEPLPEPYEVKIEGGRFTNVTSLKIGGAIGDSAVDPRDNSTIFYTTDGQPGAIYRALKTSPGIWQVDPSAIVSGLDRPSGLVVDAQGTLWWTHDFTMSLMRLKAPYTNSTPETIISNFGPLDTDDDPIDLAIAPASFANSANFIVVADRGTDGDSENSLYLIDPATSELKQTNYQNYLVPPSVTAIGSANLNAIAPVAASSEVAVINGDAFIYLVDGNGVVRSILPNIYADPGVSISPTAIGVDPTTSRVWLADNVFKQIWSIPTAGADPERLEVSFVLKQGSRTDSNITFHDPGVTFSSDGNLLVVTDGSTGNGGGRLHIFHNEQAEQTGVTITSAVHTPQGFELQWSTTPGASYRVQRAATLGTAFEDISGVLTTATHTDANPAADRAFYRIIVVR
jgi:hypothetical protein